jgi:AcrR family transcriptional regulator
VSTERRTNEERTRTTRRALVAAARRQFESAGYAGTNLGRVAELAGVTKGALYHHFPTKLALYDAVVVDIQDEIYARADRRVQEAGDGWDRLVQGFVSFVETASDPSARLLLVEAPAVLGHRRWHEIDDERNLPGILELLQDLDDQGELAFGATTELARALAVMVNALAALVSEDDDPTSVERVVIPLWEHVLRSLRAAGPTSTGGHRAV